MPEENERRYIILSMNEKILEKSHRFDIKQGYYDLSYPEHRSLRIRLIYKHNKKDPMRAVMAVKEGFGISRQEEPKETDFDSGIFLMNNCSHFLEKTRYLPEGSESKGRWIVDVLKPPLKGKIAEIEFEKNEQEIKIPPWIYKCIEVTEILSSINLARLATELRKLNNNSCVSLSDLLL